MWLIDLPICFVRRANHSYSHSLRRDGCLHTCSAILGRNDDSHMIYIYERRASRRVNGVTMFRNHLEMLADILIKDFHETRQGRRDSLCFVLQGRLGAPGIIPIVRAHIRDMSLKRMSPDMTKSHLRSRVPIRPLPSSTQLLQTVLNDAFKRRGMMDVVFAQCLQLLSHQGFNLRLLFDEVLQAG